MHSKDCVRNQLEPQQNPRQHLVSQFHEFMLVFALYHPNSYKISFLTVGHVEMFRRSCSYFQSSVSPATMVDLQPTIFWHTSLPKPSAPRNECTLFRKQCSVVARILVALCWNLLIVERTSRGIWSISQQLQRQSAVQIRCWKPCHKL